MQYQLAVTCRISNAFRPTRVHRTTGRTTIPVAVSTPRAIAAMTAAATLGTAFSDLVADQVMAVVEVQHQEAAMEAAAAVQVVEEITAEAIAVGRWSVAEAAAIRPSQSLQLLNRNQRRNPRAKRA